jgi:ketosteroid isomerase-like protein
MPPTAAVVSFIDAINRGDVERLAQLMTDDHRLQVMEEVPLDGKAANVEAWRGYADAFPRYVIYPEQIVGRGGRVAVVGRTTGSHLLLTDSEELRLTVIWRAEVSHGLLSLWQVIEDTPASRLAHGLRPAE